ncbi:hypothetical protein [Thermoactinomyces sp. DSM 45892]|uniref:hypothetical protein n=1 Tax=Thermoactinomyces sp. DSM 45892 TaxID=1882753 RepID=UPI00089B6015|nr:hypothetical protein [Thermoactinomyces sp. DSM 45892]SDZ00306.1 hypothetical protein SAMN05444416_11190 [Thermoactinomyces sp. DSM 45892]
MKWYVYEFCKQYFMRTGRLPEWEMVLSEFQEVDVSEVAEGMSEFDSRIQIHC